jgi:hypothetical protein
MDRPEHPQGTAFEEAEQILQRARDARVTLRLVGGWAIQLHCTEHDFCDREHPDIDFVGLSSQYEDIVRVMKDMGYVENQNMTLATSVSRLLFERPGSSDYVDVFLDSMDIEHYIDLRDRLEIEEDTLSVSDLLLIKLTISRLNEKDVRDIVTMLKDLEFGSDDTPRTVNRAYLARVCSKSWGLYHDVLLALRKIRSLLARYSFPEDTESTVESRLDSLNEAIIREPKSLRWKLRALLGERIAWKRPVETEGVKLDSIQQRVS